MKTVYHTEIHFSLTLKTGETITDHQRHYITYYHYSYGELPETETVEYNNPDTVFEDLSKVLGYLQPFTGSKTFFKKRIYIDDYNFDKRIYKDELISFKVIKQYIPHENMKTLDLMNKLTFEDYSQFVFDRERELQNILLFKQEN
jgi:hypothetical protein